MPRMSLIGWAALCWLAVSAPSRAENVALQDIILEVPQGWTVHQEAADNGTLLIGFANGRDYARFYVKRSGDLDFKGLFGPGVQIVKAETLEAGPFDWDTIEATRPATGDVKAAHTFAFRADFRGHVYYGYSAGSSVAAARATAERFLSGIKLQMPSDGTSRSLTATSFTGKKYYLGWGAAGAGDPSMMHNEVKYDVLHTHDIFTKNVGGGYLGTQLIGTTVNGTAIRAEWAKLKGTMTSDDMLVQYSSGHGSPSGLGVGVSYNEIRDAVLALPGRELVVFIMACHSGGLVDGFDAKKAVWEKWAEQGRTLFVLASSKKSQTSSTGPGTDPDQPGAPNGSAGSAFGHALWKSLIGYADGYVDGVKDGYLSLGEIRDFSVWKTQKIGGHTPVHTGAYNANLVMNRVPPKSFLDRLEGGTEGLSDEQVIRRIQELDAAMRVN